MTDENLLKAIECCRDEDCDNCPLMSEICDRLCVEMTDVPIELLDMIGMKLCEK